MKWNRVGDVLPETFEKLGLGKTYFARKLFVEWRSVVGAEIAGRTRPASYRRGILTVAVNSSVWIHHLTMMKEEIVRRIGGAVGENVVTDIRFISGSLNPDEDMPDEGDFREESPPERPVTLSEQDKERCRSILQDLPTGVLRDRLNKLVRKDIILKKRRSARDWRPCSTCGTLCAPGNDFCSSCAIRRNEEVRGLVRRILLDGPWITAEECNRYCGCSREQYISARDELIAGLAREAAGPNPDRLRVMTLVMLLTGLSPDQLTEEKVNEVLKAVRGKQHVSASRS